MILLRASSLYSVSGPLNDRNDPAWTDSQAATEPRSASRARPQQE